MPVWSSELNFVITIDKKATQIPCKTAWQFFSTLAYKQPIKSGRYFVYDFTIDEKVNMKIYNRDDDEPVMMVQEKLYFIYSWLCYQ